MDKYINIKINKIDDFIIKTYSVKPTDKNEKVIKYGGIFISLKNFNKYNIHNVSKNTLLNMKSRYIIPEPMYFGIFIQKKELLINLQITQKTPLHMYI